ncbi:MAG: hypothetical protein RIF33_13425 [Cyclobacteriaceae bacterium]
MLIFRILLAVFFIIIATYSGIVIADYGFTLFPIFINDMLSMTWSGQFNLDFSLYLALSGIWIAWRQRFSLIGIVLGVIASILGMAVFAPYLLAATFKAEGDIKTVLLGENWADR